MKTVYKTKNWLYSIAILLITACLCVIGGFMLSEKPKTVASAAADGGITFETGASVRIDTQGDTSGIRFTAIVSDEVYNKVTENGEIKTDAELGMIIVPQTYVDAFDKAGATDYFNFFSQKIAKKDISVSFTTDMLTRVAGGYQMRGALVKLYAKNYERDYRAIAYYTLDNGASYTYYINEEERNVSQVSVLAIQGENKAKPYTEAQLDVLYTYTNGSIPRVLYDASKQSHTQLLNVNTPAELSQSNGAFAIALTAEPADKVLIIKPDFLVDANLSSYQGGNIYFTVKTDVSGATCSVTGGAAVTLTQNSETTISVPVSNYTGDFKITIRNLTASAKVWISDIAVCVKHNGGNWVYPDATSHSGTCKDCMAEVEGSCTFVDGVCSVCGRKKVEEAPVCTHENVTEWTHVENTTTHSKICNDCGETLLTENCMLETAYEQVDTNRHTKTTKCTVCEHVISSKTVTCSSGTCVCGRESLETNPDDIVWADLVDVSDVTSENVEELEDDFLIGFIDGGEETEHQALTKCFNKELIAVLDEEGRSVVDFYGDYIAEEATLYFGEEIALEAWEVHEIYGFHVSNYQEVYGELSLNASFPTPYSEGQQLFVVVSFQGEAGEWEHFFCYAQALEDGQIKMQMDQDVLMEAAEKYAVISIVSELSESSEL